MQLLSGIAQFLTRPPSTTDHRSDPATNPDNFASHGGEEVEDLEGTSGARTDVTSNVRRGNSSFLSRGHFAKPSGRSNMRREDETSDEQRLFPTYKQSQDDVRITVGQSFAKPKKSRVNQHSILRPVDLITPNGKDSGPVRARGGSNTTNTSVQHSTSSRHPLSSPTRVDNEHRALKRRRHSSSPVIDLVDDDEGNTIRNRSPSVASVESPEDREKEKTPTRVFKVPEYDEDDDPEESYVGVKSTRTQHRPNKPIETVEVDDDDARSQGEEDKAGSEKRRRSDASESPDELQEDVTFRTNPESFASNRPTIGSYSFLYEADQKPSKGVKRRLSPNDIRPTVFNSSNKTPDRRQPRNQRITRTHKYLFDVKFFRYGSIQLDHRQLFLDQGNDTIGLHQSIPPVSIPIRRIIQVLLGAEGSLKCRFTLSKIQGATNKDSVDIEFATEAEKDQLCGLLPKTARIREKTGEWMDKAFDNVVIVEPVRGKRLSSPDITESGESTKPEPVKRQRLSATLQGEDEPLKGINQPPRRVPLPVTQSVSIAPKTPRSGDDEGVSIPVKTYQASCKERETRSKARRGLVDLIDDEPDSSPKSDSGDRWSKPLVYPPVGKKKAEVNSYDLERLRDGEFLNDNLIGFYARFLEHYLERNKPEASKRVYFFNSYFYATLTSPVKGRRGVNYQGVSKWTRNVDLFSHDYVVVPINESAHWYLAIICNLSTLKKRSEVKEIESSQEEPEAQKKVINQKEIPETPPPREAATPEETARDSLAAMKIDDVPNSKPQNGPNSEDEWPEKEENQTSPPAVFHGDIPSESDAAKKKFKSSGPAYSIDQPTIITFDSLNEPRQPAIKVLKQYLMEESIKAKISFEMKDIKGMTAKGIPLQPNYSDCGLYLLAYLEKFVQDPDEFVRKILRREMSIQIDWPPLKSGWLRRRLRDFLFKLHKEQDPGQDTGLLVDTQPISYLLGPPVQSAKKVQDVEVAPVAEPEPEVIVDSFQDKEEANDDAVSDVESVIQETQFSEQQGVPVPQLEQETTDESKEEQHVEEVIEVPKTPDREINNDAAVLDSSPVVIANSAPDAQKETPHRDQQAQRDIFEEMSDYLSRTPPRDNVEVQIPTVQVPDTPRAKKTRKERTSPRQIKSKKKI